MGITTVRQPLERSGQRVADLVVQALGGSALSPFAEEMELELVVRRHDRAGPRRRQSVAHEVRHRQSSMVARRRRVPDVRPLVRRRDGDGVGDLRRHRQRISITSPSLGVDAVWLTPCFPSPQRDHGYDVADYFDIDPAVRHAGRHSTASSPTARRTLDLGS